MIGVAIMISRGLLKTGLGVRFGYMFIAVWGKRTLGIGYSLAISDLLLAPVTPSNTARGGAIVHPVMRAIAGSFDSDRKKAPRAKSANIWHWLTTTPTSSAARCLSPPPRPTPWWWI